jgi:hypothetical protein
VGLDFGEFVAEIIILIRDAWQALRKKRRGLLLPDHRPERCGTEEALKIVQPDAYYRRLSRRSDRRDRGLILLFVTITLIFFGGLFVWMFLSGPIHH